LNDLEGSFVATAKRLAAIVVLTLLFASAALAAPRAESVQECTVAADMAVVARSLAEEQVQRPKAGAIMSRIYDLEASERGKQLMQQILDAAYTKKDSSSSSFAEELFVTCLRNDGDMDGVLGRST
jgi:lipopolysaccharide export LptBFGC system permease protein LptF